MVRERPVCVRCGSRDVFAGVVSMQEDEVLLPFDREERKRRLWHCSSCDFSWAEEVEEKGEGE